MESFKASQRKAFNGQCLLIVQTTEKKGTITITASSEGLQTAMVALKNGD
jgi:beta-galactosidase